MYTSTIALVLLLVSYPSQLTIDHAGKVLTLGSSDAQKLDRGEILKYTSVLEGKDGRHFGWGTSAGLVEESFEEMKKIILDLESFPGFLPGLEELKVNERHGNNILAYHRVKALWMKFEYNLVYTIHNGNNDLKISWALDRSKKNDLVATQGYWYIMKWDDKRTLLVYSSFVDSGKNMPEVIEKFVMSLTLPRVSRTNR